MGRKGRENELLAAAEDYSDEVLAFTRKLRKRRTERALIDQLMKAGTSVGANVSEAQQAQGRRDFISKLEIASKECRESEQWFGLFYRAGDISKEEYTHFKNQWVHIQCLIASSATTAKKNLEEEERRKKETRRKKGEKQKALEDGNKYEGNRGSGACTN